MTFPWEERAQAIRLAVKLRAQTGIPIDLLLHEADTIQHWIETGDCGTRHTVRITGDNA